MAKLLCVETIISPRAAGRWASRWRDRSRSAFHGVKFAGSAGVVVRGWGRVVIVYPVVVYSTVFSKDSGLMAGVVASGLSESEHAGGDL
eukprot:7391587-Prymnesium_polylepis.1